MIGKIIYGYSVPYNRAHAETSSEGREKEGLSGFDLNSYLIGADQREDPYIHVLLTKGYLCGKTVDTHSVGVGALISTLDGDVLEGGSKLFPHACVDLEKQLSSNKTCYAEIQFNTWFKELPEEGLKQHLLALGRPRILLLIGESQF